jgi:hypothetical protein
VDQPPITTLTPGWFPDPLRRYEFRYHNGERWTGDVSVDGRLFIDPLGAGPSSAAGSAAGPFVGRGAARPPRHPARLTGVWAFVCGLTGIVLAWMPILFVVGAVAAIAGLVLGLISLRRSRDVLTSETARDASPPPDTARGFARFGVAAAPAALGLCVVGLLLTRVTLREVRDFTNPGRYQLQTGTCALNAGQASFEGTITNQDTRSRQYTIQIRYLDVTRSLATASVTTASVTPGSTVTWRDQRFLGNAQLRCEVTDVNGPYPFGLGQN